MASFTPLSVDEIGFFKEYGYLIKRNVLDLELCAQARDALWEGLRDDCPMKRDDPASWVGPVPKDKELLQDKEKGGRSNIYDGFRWWRRDIGSTDYMRELMVRNTTLRGWAGQLLGDLMPEKIPGHGSTRGINVTLPFGDHPPRGGPDHEPNTQHGDYETCHNDAHSMSLGVIGLIDHVPPEIQKLLMGRRRQHDGLASIPPPRVSFNEPTAQQRTKSARKRYTKQPDGTMLKGQQGVNEDSPYADELRRIHEDTQPVVFWHHRTGHTASANRSPVLRQAVLYEFHHSNLAEICDAPPPDDMWRDWTDELRSVPRSWSMAVAEEQGLLGQVVGGTRVTKDNATAPLPPLPHKAGSAAEVSAKM